MRCASTGGIDKQPAANESFHLGMLVIVFVCVAQFFVMNLFIGRHCREVCERGWYTGGIKLNMIPQLSAGLRHPISVLIYLSAELLQMVPRTWC